jgi:hypothetical protein
MFWIIVVPGLLHSVELPMGSAPEALATPHFPDRLHAFVWRNWQLVPPERLAQTVGTSPDTILEMGRSMGLSGPPSVSEDQWRRSYITIIRRNWHLLPYDQLLTLLGWTADQLAFCLREDDALFTKLGSLKPQCPPLAFSPPAEQVQARAAEIAAVVRAAFPAGVGTTQEPLFGFVDALSKPADDLPAVPRESAFSPRFCYSYFALYGDPLMDDRTDPFPDAYLGRLAAAGVNGVWLQAVLYKLFPFPWDESLSEGYETRLANLAKLVARARRHGVGVYLYLNEPRAMPMPFFDAHADLKGVVEGDHAALCTSVPEVRAFIRDAVASICKAVPDLAGFFTITASENLTTCWSHFRGQTCPRCAERGPVAVVAELNALIQEVVSQAGSGTQLIAWDWGWADDWTEGIVAALPKDVSLMSVSEWSIPIRRGGVDSVVGEYSISEVGPGPRAQRHWAIARNRGMKTIAKIQANNTWELSSVPYIPALENVAEHAANLRDAHVDGLMLGWTLGGYPSPNLDVVAEVGSSARPTPQQALETVARRWYGEAAPAVSSAWRGFSTAFREFPFHIGTLYQGPMQMGPANPCWETATGYVSTMVGFPYDDLLRWRSVYPADVFIAQFEKVAAGFEQTLATLKRDVENLTVSAVHKANLAREIDVAEACAIHFRSVANQARFVSARDALAGAETLEAARPHLDELERVLTSELDLAVRLHAIQCRDSRIGFEASNHYFYVPVDLAEKVVNCTDLLTRWLPAQRTRYGS